MDGSDPHVLPLPEHWLEDSGTHSGIWTPGGKHFIFSSYKDGPNNLYEYLQPRWFEFWKKPSAVKLTPGQPEVTAMAPSRDGNGMFVVGRLAQGSMHFYDSKWIAYSDWHELYRVSVDSGAPEKLTSEGFTEVLPSWAPNGKSIYFNDYPISGHQRIRILDLETRKVSTMPGSDGYYAPLWSPDGRYLVAIQNPPKSLAIYSVETKQWKQLKVFQHEWGFFVWAPDSKSLYLMRGPAEAGTSEQTGIYRLTVPDGKWELFTKLIGLNPLLNGTQDFVSITPEGKVAAMTDTSVTQIYQMKWKNTE